MRRERILRFEYPILILLSTAGMMLSTSANDLISLYLALELQSLALYVVRRLPPRSFALDRSSSVTFCAGRAVVRLLLLYGSSLVYGYTGATSFDAHRRGRARARRLDWLHLRPCLRLGGSLLSRSRPCHSRSWLDARCLRRRADAGDRLISRQRPRWAAMAMAHPRRSRALFPKRGRPVAADRDRDRDCIDGAWRVCGHRSDEHQAAACLFLHRPCRLCADRRGRGDAHSGGRAQGRHIERADLSRDLPRHDGGEFRLRSRHATGTPQ